jgi:hypothetical protein
MYTRHASRRTDRRRGIAYAFALLMLVLLGTLAASFASTTGLGLAKAANQRRAIDSRMAAEGGLSYMAYLIAQTDISSVSTPQQFLDTIAASIAQDLNGSGMLGGQSVSYDGQTLTVPPAYVHPDAAPFSATLSLQADSSIALNVVGQRERASQSVGVRYALQRGGGFVFDHAIVTRGTLFMGGNADVTGVNDPSEASLLVMSDETDVLDMGGNASVEGDIYITNPDGLATLGGNSSVGGEARRDAEVWDHIHVGVDPVDLPEIDITPYAPLATNLVTSSTSTNGNYTLENIRIEAGANPCFNGNYTIRGVIYVESPNVIQFMGNTTIEGVIVTDDAGDDACDTNRIEFRGNTTINGPQVLPDTSQFQALKQLEGAFLLAPGFATEFRGNFGTVCGSMAAEQFEFRGNSGGTVKGTIIAYGDETMDLRGNYNFSFDHSEATSEPDGFTTTPTSVSMVPGSYTEN